MSAAKRRLPSSADEPTEKTSLLEDDAASSAALIEAVSRPRGNELRRTEKQLRPYYYIVRYRLDARPAIACFTVVQSRLYCLKVKATQPAARGNETPSRSACTDVTFSISVARRARPTTV